MKTSHFLSLAGYLALAQALPAIIARSSSPVSVTFNGAAGASYTILVPLDGSVTSTGNVLSISSITSSYDIGEFCTLSTVDYPPALVEGPPGTWVVGPPQTVKSISCVEGSSPPPPAYITIDFLGAADAKYELSVPLDGSFTPTNNLLSISQLQSSYDVTTCTFKYVDGSAALVQIAPDTWNVGPPQTINGVQCG